MISGEDLKALATSRVGESFPLLLRSGTGRIIAADDARLDLLVAGLRARLTWGRLDAAVARLLANVTLSVDELGGGHDAVGLVSLLCWLFPDELEVLSEKGLLVVRAPAGVPVHQYADMSGLVRRWPYHRRPPAR